MSTRTFAISKRGGISFCCALLLLIAAAPSRAVIQLDGQVDARGGHVAPLAAATAQVGAQGWTARWNRFGTVQVLYKAGGFLATGLSGDPESAARGWIGAHGALFRL